MSETALVGALIVSHGQLAQELVTIAEIIVGNELAHLRPVAIGWHDEIEESESAIRAAIRALDRGKGVIVLTDMFGGTPSNLSLPLLEEGRVEIVTGVNLPMVIKLATQDGSEDLRSLVNAVREQGQSHIAVAADLLKR